MATGRRALLAASGLAAAGWTMGRPGAAEGFPRRPVTWIVPGGPGSALDVGARLVGAKMAPRLGQPVVVANRVGAGGGVAAEAAARADPDGHTVFFGNSASLALAPLLHPNLRFDARRDFAPVRGIGASVQIVVCGVDRPFRDVPGLVARARARPGEVTYAAGAGSAQHLAAALFAREAGVELAMVPHSDFALALRDVEAGRIDLCFDFPVSCLPAVRDGRLRALAVGSGERLAAAPGVPTLAEAGLPGAGLLGWSGLYAPARTPPAAAARLDGALRAALRDPEVRALMDGTGTVPWAHVDAAGLERALDEEIPRMRSLVERTGLRAG